MSRHLAPPERCRAGNKKNPENGVLIIAGKTSPYRQPLQAPGFWPDSCVNEPHFTDSAQ